VKYLVIIAGPTAVGKTETAIAVARHFSTEIISSDSRQIFIEPTIGTAKPSSDELSSVPHHLIATVHVTDYYNAYMFEHDALHVLDTIFVDKDVAVHAGGSGLYVDAVCHGIDEIPDIRPEIRERVNRQFEEEGIESLRHALHILDPTYYAEVDLQNPARLKRAIEICIQTGQAYSQLRTQTRRTRPFTCIKIALTRPREELYTRINKRVDAMVAAGLEDEVRSLQAYRDCMALKTVGYREFFEYFDGQKSYEQTIEAIKQNTRRYAKKQITWLKRTDEYTWFAPEHIDEIIAFIQSRIRS